MKDAASAAHHPPSIMSDPVIEKRPRGEDSAPRACADHPHERHPLGHALSFEQRDRVRATILKLSPSAPVGRAAGRRRLAA